MTLEKIQQGLIDKFVTAFSDWSPGRIAWENRHFTPPTALPWMYFYFMDADERISTLGPIGQDEINGLVQIDVNYPAGAGESDLRETINLLRTCFAPTVFIYDSQPITILSRSRSGGRTTDGFYRVPFTVRWRSFLNRP